LSCKLAPGRHSWLLSTQFMPQPPWCPSGVVRPRRSGAARRAQAARAEARTISRMLNCFDAVSNYCSCSHTKLASAFNFVLSDTHPCSQQSSGGGSSLVPLHFKMRRYSFKISVNFLALSLLHAQFHLINDKFSKVLLSQQQLFDAQHQLNISIWHSQ
jgi:hypothetical protein